jgi:hypothetical protein
MGELGRDRINEEKLDTDDEEGRKVDEDDADDGVEDNDESAETD